MQKRHFLFGLSTLTLPSLLKAQYGAKKAKAKNVIYVFLEGGISAQETFNPKPLAPVEYRGPFGAIKTKTDGLLFSEQFPLLSLQTDKFSVIQSMTHGSAAHELGTSYMYTGYKSSPAIQYASVGSVISKELGVRNSLPAYVTVPKTPNPSANAGFLSSQFNPFSLGADPFDTNFKVQDLNLTVENERFNRRRFILEAVDSKFKAETNSDNTKAIDMFYEQAFDLISSQKAKEAFDITKENQKVRDNYGVSQIGARLLMARRLIEAGVRIVKINYGSFDHHDNIGPAMSRQLPQLDRALASLFEDLAERGLLNETLVIVTSEFGRTPKINRNAGRDHESRLFSTIVGGGGVQNGIVYGETNEISSEVSRDPVSPEDLFATIFHLTGIDPKKELFTNDSRPIQISKGTILTKVLS